MKARGEIRAFGMGINEPPEFERFAAYLPVDFFVVAMPYTLLEQGVLDTAMKACVDRGIRVIIGAPFALGPPGRSGERRGDLRLCTG